MWWSVLPTVSALWALGLALMVLARNRRSRMHQSFALGMLALSVMEVGHFMAVIQADDEVWWTRVALAGQILLPLPWLMFSLTFGRPDPLEQLRRWRAALAFVAAASLAFLGLLVFKRHLAEDLSLRPVGLWFNAFLLLSLTLVLVNLERTVRSADRGLRWRMKYLILAVFAIMAVAIFDVSQVILYESAERWIAPLFSSVMILGCGLMTFAVVRYRLFEVDIFLSRYVVYNSLTLILVGVYLLGVGLAAQAVKSLGGDSSAYWSALVVVVSVIALAVVLLSYDVRTRMKVFINRHFFKYKYDYRKEWMDLTERLSSKPTVEAIASALSAMLFDTFWIRDTYLWLADERERELAPAEAHPETEALHWTTSALAALKARDEPLVVAAPAEQRLALPDGAPAEALRALGIRILVPLVVQDRLVGVVGLGAPHTASPLTEEDFDLLKTIGKQVAASVFNAQLLHELVASKELESFHAFSTFLLHDLKNFVSMLSLLVDNMERNFDSPAFRQDALKNLSQTVDKMKRLMERLRALAQSPAPAFEPVDISQIGRAVVHEVQPSLNATVLTEWGTVPPVRADAAQIRRVLINLLLNAEEAVGGRGEIHVSTRADNGMVTCRVADNGPGITPEFLQTRLFKPFATTKSGGFGVGLYQCKTIIEAHGGRVAAESRVGQGSILSFSIPATKDM
ncbi:MAG TPA: XrtA/PEP-CTERM system histidine kinase PrsK [Nitrospiria bacterium]|nr:XrtA/PEP-CTERM system histidine kinase PrsK [Nitrospiria bacterium]